MKLKTKQLAETLLAVTAEKTGKKLEQAVADFTALLARRHELTQWREVVRAFNLLWRRKYGAAEIKIRSAHPLSVKTLKILSDRVPAASLIAEVDPELLGGASIQIDDKIIDGTIMAQLEQLRAQL